MRHGQADPATSRLSDYDRCLSTLGEQQAKSAAQHLQNLYLQPQKILCSPADRTKSTALIVSQRLNMATHQIVFAPRLYEASLSDFLTLLTEQGDNTNVLMLIAHNPGLEKLLHYLNLPRQEKYYLHTASLAVLSINKAWHLIEDGDANLISLIPGKH